MDKRFFHLFRAYDLEAANKFPRFPAIVQEKFDGVRAIYDPLKNGMWLRKNVDQRGRFIELPPGFIESKHYLDGEIATKKHPCDFKIASGAVRHKNPQFGFWSSALRFIVFDIADPELRHVPYSERLKTAQAAASTAGPFVEPIRNLGENITSIPEILALRDTVISDGGEGVISRGMDAEYTVGRSVEDFKFKKIFRVSAVITGYIKSNTPRFKIGSLKVSVPELGITNQRVGSGLTTNERKTEESIRYHYPVNSRVILEYMETTEAGKLREPRIVGKE